MVKYDFFFFTWRDCVAKNKEAFLEAECDVIQQNLIEETVTGMVKHIASSVKKDTEIEKKTILVKYKHDFQRRKLAAYFKQYEKYFFKNSLQNYNIIN